MLKTIKLSHGGPKIQGGNRDSNAGQLPFICDENGVKAVSCILKEILSRKIVLVDNKLCIKYPNGGISLVINRAVEILSKIL